jgi:hypothetical protein
MTIMARAVAIEKTAVLTPSLRPTRAAAELTTAVWVLGKSPRPILSQANRYRPTYSLQLGLVTWTLHVAKRHRCPEHYGFRRSTPAGCASSVPGTTTYLSARTGWGGEARRGGTGRWRRRSCRPYSP